MSVDKALTRSIKVDDRTSSSSSFKPMTDSNLLTVPGQQLRRASIESAFSGSDISEFSFTSLQNEDLLRTVSNTSVLSPVTWRTWLGAFWIANYGAFLVLLSQIFGAVMSIATRLLETPGPHGEPMHPFQILFARQSITVLITTTYALWSKSVPNFPLGPPGKVRLLLVSRGLFGFLGVFGFYFSLLYLPISEAIVLTFVAPIGTCIAFAMLLPGEVFTRRQQLAGLISLVGVLFIARPGSLFSGSDGQSSNGEEDSTEPTTQQHLQAVGVAMIGVVGAIGAMTSIRAIGDRAHALLSVNYFSVWCTFVSLLALLVMPSVKFRLPGNALEWTLLAILGVAGFVMQLLLTQGMAYGASSSDEKTAALSDIEMQSDRTRKSPTKASGGPIKGSGAKATSMMYTQMLFALISDKVVFGITPIALSWVGSGLILFGAIWVAADGSSSPAKSPKDTETIEINGQEIQVKSGVAEVQAEERIGLLAEADDDNETDIIQKRKSSQ